MPDPLHAASGTAISPALVNAALAVERHALPWAYIFFALMRADALLNHFEEWRHTDDTAFAFLVRDVLLLLLMLFMAVATFFSRPPVAVPDRLNQVLIPIAMSYYFFLYGLVDHLPAPLRANLIAQGLQGAAALAGLVVSIAGYGVTIWALCHLRSSFGVLVAVRKVVTTGPYARVRHPMYLGYVMDLCGLLLASFSIAMLVLASGFLVLLRLRAGLEEKKLADADAGYREYLARSGCLFPKFRLVKLGSSSP